MQSKQKTYYENKPENGWVQLDASGQVLGRFASNIAFILLGKHKVNHTPSTLTGHAVIVTNVDKLKVTGRKMEQKHYYRHSRYPGHLKELPLKDLFLKAPEQVLQAAVKTMLPRNKQTKHLLGRLRIFSGSNHPHAAQKPQPLSLTRRKV